MITNIIKWIVTSCFLIVSHQSFAAQWPTTFVNSDGTTTVIKAKPQRVLSTSVSITGTLLAIDAPVIGSASAANHQFFAQWQEVAKQRGVVDVWPAGSVDIEMAYALQPDLIVVSSSGADSARAHIAQLQQVAPTIVLDYSKQTWQDLANRLGKALGLEQQVAKKIEQFNAYLKDSKEAMSLPEGRANIISYQGPGAVNPIATAQGSHGQLLSQLGFDIEQPNPAWQTALDHRQDFIRSHYEHLTQLKAQTSFLLTRKGDQVDDFLNDPVLANLPSVQAKQVYGLGKHSFRIDYYSAHEIVEQLVQRFAK
ncbi:MULTISPECIES: Fe2+-enterobactin ABC transporter substrate-binding protein [unclassified Vibrio]|uniref:Fe2+-enterobactin ABC transporter substrate-binding protein n=1 Tax=Vibrio sp. HB236076 TaxID=3232307 RepID=A0AB39HCE4_9VIBR|nr:Fe2+-enterobactin ABC transporter substrate-binding protein [Vibrio sp. HB161653]MDP5253792.1 Fe2+-enterobactin ABC transporter substrate-binding protein [Vibrio sp. HB161653]